MYLLNAVLSTALHCGLVRYYKIKINRNLMQSLYFSTLIGCFVALWNRVMSYFSESICKKENFPVFLYYSQALQFD